MSEEMKKYFRLVPVEHEALVEEYKPTLIKKDTYDWVKQDVKTCGVNLLLMNRITYMSPEERKSIEYFLSMVRDNYKKLSTNCHSNFKEVDFNLATVNKLKVSEASKTVFGLE